MIKPTVASVKASQPKVAMKVAEIEAAGGGFDQVHEYVSGTNQDKAWTTGDIEAGMVTTGQAGALVDDLDAFDVLPFLQARIRR